MCYNFAEVIFVGKTSSKVKDRYNAKAYDEMKIRVPKGQKALIEAAAKAAGESVNEYTQRALLARLGITEWPVRAEAPSTES